MLLLSYPLLNLYFFACCRSRHLRRFLFFYCILLRKCSGNPMLFVYCIGIVGCTEYKLRRKNKPGSCVRWKFVDGGKIVTITEQNARGGFPKKRENRSFSPLQKKNNFNYKLQFEECLIKGFLVRHPSKLALSRLHNTGSNWWCYTLILAGLAAPQHPAPS